MTSARHIPFDDRSYLYGDGLFETVRVRPDGSIRWLSAHMERIQSSGAALGFSPASVAEATAALESLAARKPGIWRVTMSRSGVDGDGNPVPFGGSGCVATRFRPYHPPNRPRLGIAHGFYRPDDPLAEHKTTSFLRSIEARRRAHLAGFDDAVMVSAAEQVGEASTANLVVVHRGRAVTPPARGILPGVTRRGLIELSRDFDEPIEVREVALSELYEADEIVLLSAGIGVLAAASFEGRALDDTWARRAAEWLP